jgi:N-methylhydantoinase B/oxoprolinase/acetone carboxylase alpha subunit
VLTLVESGGGGFGPAASRSRARIEDDLSEGFVTPEGAWRDYGHDG